MHPRAFELNTASEALPTRAVPAAKNAAGAGSSPKGDRPRRASSDAGAAGAVLRFSRALALFPVLALPAVPALAGGPGTTAAPFLGLGFGARPIGLGEAYVAVADDVSALHYNPAGLAFAPSPFFGRAGAPYEFMAAHAMHIQDVSLDQFGFIRRPWGLSVTRLQLGGLEGRTSETDAADGRFGASDMMVGLSYGRTAGGIGVGGTVKFIQETIGSASASAYAVDAGVIKRFERRPVSVGLGVANVGTKIKFIDQGYPLPMTWRAGVTYGMTPKFPHALSLQIDFPADTGPVLRLGAEYLGFGPFALRGGYMTVSRMQKQAALGSALGATASGLSEFYGMFLGFGFRSRFGNLDYALLPYGELGNAHRLSFGMRFGKANTESVRVMK